LAALAAFAPASAQYDRDGRYVPSPLGQPADPYRSTIPNYSGKPGAAIGTPKLPRAYDVQPRAEPQLRRDAPVVRYPGQTSLPVPLTIEQCEEAWSAKTRVSRVEFNRRCARMLRARAQKKAE
jgi:hypothetical protein